MDQGLDPHMKRILHNATEASSDNKNLECFRFPARQSSTIDWSSRFVPWKSKHNQGPCFSPDQGVSDPHLQSIQSAEICYNKPSMTFQDRESAQAKLSRTISSLDAGFRLGPNQWQATMPDQFQLRAAKPQYPDTLVRAASALAIHQPQLPFGAEQFGFEPQGFSEPKDNENSQIYLQRQQVKEPLRTSFYNQSPTYLSLPHSSPPFESSISSPSTRISLRRVKSQQAPQLNPFLSMDTQFSSKNTPELCTPRHYTSSVSDHSLQALDLKHAPMIVQGIQLVSPYELPDRIRSVFPYELFNAAQSKCFAPIFNTNDNVVVSAPTGSGKTALLELAICRLAVCYSQEQFKIVYLAPTKSLCSERNRDWQKKFCHLNLPCAELTGDTNQFEMARVRTASIIITTPEKWDSITRKWSDHHRLVQMVKLFLIDEVHILKDIRGATLEAVVSRMKAMGANVRFIALSATVPNSEDIALWLGRDHTNQHLPAHRETFGESFRPVKLRKHVHAYDGTLNDYAFEKFLDGKLTSLLQKYTQRKPIMIFCFTRKSCETTASMLSEWWLKQRLEDRAWPAPLQKIIVGNKELQSLVTCGVAFHHAGLDAMDRCAIETGYLKGHINLICCTSTLAIGVNLPCHMVILKGTVGFQDGFLREYSDLEVMQMLGRAGRPQFDDSAVAIIMTRADKAERYKKMISGQDILESTLHLNLIEHLNSEISLGSVKDLHQAKTWITKTFLSVRMRQNPRYYQITGVSDDGDTDQRLEKVCERDINLLREHNLVRNEAKLACTEYGEAMCKYMVQFETMKLLLSIPKQAKTEQILEIICQAIEFRDLRIKPSERACLRKLNNSASIKFPINQTVSTTSHKVSLIIQVQLGGVQYPEEKDFGVVRRQFSIDKNIIFERIQRLIRCVAECKAKDHDAVSTRHALDFARSLSAGYWDNSNLQLRQVPQIGPVAHRKLSKSNINTIQSLMALDTASIERILSKNPPFGRKIKDTLVSFPRLKVSAEVKRDISKQGQNPQVLVRAILGYENKEVPFWNSRKPNVVFVAETSSGNLEELWRGNILKLNKGFEIEFKVMLNKVDEEIKCWLACEEIVGTTKSITLRHEIPASDFPVLASKIVGQNTKLTRESTFDDSDEFGNSEFNDEEILAVVQKLEKPASNFDSDELSDVDRIEKEPSPTQTQMKSQTIVECKKEQKASIRMRNGKWTCQHDCRDGGIRKNGQICKHRCCHEGIDKPSKIKQMKSATTLFQKESMEDYFDDKRKTKMSKKKHPSSFSQKISGNSSLKIPDDAEIIDLSVDSPYISDIDLNYDIHNESNRPKTDPFEEYVAAKPPPEQKAMSSNSDEIDLELPETHYLEKNDKFEILDVRNSSSSEILVLGSDRSFDFKPETFEDSSTIFAESPGLHMETSKCPKLKTSLIGSLDAERPRSNSKSKSGSNPVGGPVDNEVRDENYEIKRELNLKNFNCPSSGIIEECHQKRQGFHSPEIHTTKRQKFIQNDLTPRVPAWVDEFDPELIEELKDFVDFIE